MYDQGTDAYSPRKLWRHLACRRCKDERGGRDDCIRDSNASTTDVDTSIILHSFRKRSRGESQYDVVETRGKGLASMMHSVDDLLRIVYHYYPRGMWDFEPAYDDTVEYRRLDAVRKQAASGKAWHNLLDRLRLRFNHGIFNRSLALASFKSDACTWVTHSLPPDPSKNSRINDEDHEIGLAISFIAPYYVIYSSRRVDRTFHESEPERLHAFDLDDDEKVDAQIMVDEMKALFPEHEPMPPEIGNIVVPDVMAGNQELGKATLYHCFFTDSW